jgi:hypothetical protein
MRAPRDGSQGPSVQGPRSVARHAALRFEEARRGALPAGRLPERGGRPALDAPQQQAPHGRRVLLSFAGRLHR